ncbi:NADH dehydrogenase [Austwickia sp. TVS 96-490-7B]|uniref:NAD(P)/FAD-dependent oxidoreductase n=1 Tax=Austwickia sp. TVS 96-490-7B TaxID=2830843 RepID=UPI001C561EC5|nr:NAD(P)/FAD-dependent oxidoreductase [Austwickia sp. TVS 96-490-7B]MBW3086599.1 NADH dehydrogenase [Austwickia sp. TVS 96-490-7B]
MTSSSPTTRARVVVVGSGFGGLFATKALRSVDVDITLIADTNAHLFQPLLYQVATGILSEGQIAPATRGILRRQRNASVLQGLVTEIDVDAHTVTSRFHDKETRTSYDHLVLAAGAGQSYFGNDHFATYAPGMKTLDDALELRSRIFGAFEQAELEEDPALRERLLTFVVVGAGPTGVEMAGQIRELASTTLTGNFRRIDPARARVLLVDGASQVLPAFGDRLGAVTQRELHQLGVEVRLSVMVTDVDATGVVIQDRDGNRERIESVCKVWAAGVQGNPLGRLVAEHVGAEVDRSGRVVVRPDLTLPGHPEIFVVGDLMSVPGVPGVAQGAIQSARFAAERIAAAVRRGGTPDDLPEQTFRYVDKGSMATISKYKAVVSVGRLRLSGFPAWVAWLLLHLLYITGFKQQVSTLLRWFITFVGSGRAERATTNQQMVGRLAKNRLGQGTSGRLIRGEPLPDQQEGH